MSQNMMWILKQLYLAMEQYGKMQTRHTDLTPTQATLLYYLLTHKEQENHVIKLHTALGISNASISATLKALRRNGYLCMEEDPSDDRKKQIILTQKAYDAEPRIGAGLAAQQKRMCNQISAPRLLQLAEDLEQMLRNLKTETEANV